MKEKILKKLDNMHVWYKQINSFNSREAEWYNQALRDVEKYIKKIK